MTTWAIVPAAGLGSRLGLDGPKLLAAVTAHDTVWSLLRLRLAGLVDGVHVVVSPAHLEAMREATAARDDGLSTTFGVQERPTGMGDAVFCGRSQWRHARTVVVIWGDQVHVSRPTIARALNLHAGASRCAVVPLVGLPEPYVEYRFDGGRLTGVLQTREGDRCRPGGRGDVGTFVLSAGELIAEWERFRQGASTGAMTGEVNFLPFLVHLAGRGWTVRPLDVDDVREARGINTPDDLVFFRRLYSSVGGPSSEGQPA